MLPFYRHRLDDHPNRLAKSLFQEPAPNRRLNTLWTGEADLRLYITTVQDG